MHSLRRRLFLHILVGLLLCAGALGQSIFARPMLVRIGDLQLTAPPQWYLAETPPDDPNIRAIIASNDPAEMQALLIVSDIPKKGRSLATYTSTTRSYIANRMDGVIEYERSRAIDGYPAQVFVYEGRSGHAQGRRRFMRTIIEKGSSFYILQGVADHLPFAAHAPALEGMVNSITWAK